jgi:hypothetical protein
MMTELDLMAGLARENMERLRKPTASGVIGISYGKYGQPTAIAVMHRSYVSEGVPGADSVLAPLQARPRRVSRIVRLERLPKDLIPHAVAEAVIGIRDSYALNDPARPTIAVVDWPSGSTVHRQLEQYLRDPKHINVNVHEFPENPQSPGGRLDLLARLAALTAAEDVSADPSIPLAEEYREQLQRVDPDARWRQADGDDLLSAVLLAMARATRGEIVFSGY